MSPGAMPLAWRCLVILAAGLTAAAQLILPTEPFSPLPPAALGAPALRPAAPESASARTSSSEILEKPLFSPTRRPWVAERAAEPETVAPARVSELDKYILRGIVLDEGTRVGLLKPSNGGKMIAAREGDVVEGWTLREITAEGLRFESGSASFDLYFASPRWPHR